VVITYHVSDGKGGTATSTATVTVAGKDTAPPLPIAPVAQDGSAKGDEDTTVTGSVKAIDSDSTSLTYSVVQGPTAAQGKLDFKADGTYAFTPAPDYNGTVTFTYKANDGTADSNVATVTLTIDAVDDAPVAVNDKMSTKAGEPVTLDVLANDTDADGGPKTIAAMTKPGNGTVVQGEGGNLTYTPAAGFSGTDTFTYTLNGGKTATVTVDVQPFPEPVLPQISVSGMSSVDEGGAVTYTFTRTGNTDAPLEVRYTVGGTAAAGDDFTAPAGNRKVRGRQGRGNRYHPDCGRCGR
jgi:hypothetical protein